MTFDAHTLLFASLAVICGSQSILFALIAKTFAITEGVLPPDPRIDRFARILPLERGLLLGLATVLLGGIMLVTRAGFEVLRTDFLFLFPRVLSALRPLEARLARFRAGAQYMVLCRKVKW